MKVLHGIGLMPALPQSRFYTEHAVHRIQIETVDDYAAEPGLPMYAKVIDFHNGTTTDIFAGTREERAQAIAELLNAAA